MKKSLIALATVFTISSAFAFPVNHNDKVENPKSEHELTVGNANAASSGSTAEDKITRQQKTHMSHRSDWSHRSHRSHNHKGNANGHYK